MVTYNDIYDRYTQQEVNENAYDIKYFIYTSGYLVQGERYTINVVGTLTDFTNVGAVTNTVGEQFICISSAILPLWGDSGELQTGYSPIQIINHHLDKARVSLQGYADRADSTVDETNIYQKEFLICQSMAFLYFANGLTDQGKILHENAIQALLSLWGSVVLESDNISESSLPPVREILVSVAKPKWIDFDAEIELGTY